MCMKRVMRMKSEKSDVSSTSECYQYQTVPLWAFVSRTVLVHRSWLKVQAHPPHTTMVQGIICSMEDSGSPGEVCLTLFVQSVLFMS
jgi:hypothetical protein